MALGSKGSGVASSPYFIAYAATVVSTVSLRASAHAGSCGCGFVTTGAASSSFAAPPPPSLKGLSSSRSQVVGLSSLSVQPFERAMRSAAMQTVVLPRSVSPACSATRNERSDGLKKKWYLRCSEREVR